jgi:hypothetical protein
MQGTRVASSLGWRAVEALAVGDNVLTFDNGMQRIVEIRRETYHLAAPDSVADQWPVIVPRNALGHHDQLTLLADQGVLVESDAAADLYGDPFAVVPAAALVGLRGIFRAAPAQEMELISLGFEDDQVIYLDGGVLVHCPVMPRSLRGFLAQTEKGYDLLSMEEGAFLATCLSWGDGGAVADDPRLDRRGVALH